MGSGDRQRQVPRAIEGTFLEARVDFDMELRRVVASLAAAVLAVGLLGCGTSTVAGDGPGANGHLDSIRVCNQILWSGAARPNVVTEPKAGTTLFPPVIVEFTRSCKHGVTVTIAPAGTFAIKTTATAQDGAAVAVFVVTAVQPPVGRHIAQLVTQQGAGATTFALEADVG